MGWYQVHDQRSSRYPGRVQEGKLSRSYLLFDLPSRYAQHNGAPFKIATLYHWVVVVTSREHVEELQHAREDELSFRDAICEVRSTLLSRRGTRFSKRGCA